MTELSVAPLTAVILALVLSVDAYNKSKIDPSNADTTQRLLITIIALVVFLLVAVIGILIKPVTSGTRMLFSVVGLVALIVALAVAWLNYINNSGKKFAVETLVIALVTSVPILATLISRDTLTIKLDL
jgi:hypothetical protein